MFTSTTARRLIIPLDDRELTVAVDGHTAVLEVVAARRDSPCSTEATDPPPEPSPVRLRIPARALVAALRVAWADEHDLRCFEPWRDVTREGRWNGYREYDRYGYGDRHGYDDDARWYDDLGDGDPDGYRDPTVVPFRMPSPPPRPARAGQPWERHEEEELRDLWLAASPEADRPDLVRQIASALERPEGGLFVRLQVVGCDPTRPGRRRYEVDAENDADTDADDDADEREGERDDRESG